jgi:hypothetical protein
MLENDGADESKESTKAVRLGDMDCTIRAGEDTAKISLYLDWEERERIFAALTEQRDKARAREIAEIDLGGKLWEVMPRGFGGENGTPHLGFKLHRLDAPDIVLALRDADLNPKCINGMIDIGSLTLMCKGSLAAVWLEMRETLDSIGATIDRNVLSRVDVAADMNGFPVNPFVEKVQACHVVGGGLSDSSFLESDHRYRRKPTGFSCRKRDGSLMLRVYDKITHPDKSEEIKYQKLEALRQIMGEMEILTRVEFEIWRKQMQYWNKQFTFQGEEIHTVEDWQAMRGDVLAYLMSDWVRLTETLPDFKNNHQSKAREWEVWRELRETSTGILREDKTIEFERPQPREDNGDHLLDQSVGCSVAYLAKHQPPMPENKVVEGCIGVFSAHAKKHKERCRNKYREQIAHKRIKSAIGTKKKEEPEGDDLFSKCNREEG